MYNGAPRTSGGHDLERRATTASQTNATDAVARLQDGERRLRGLSLGRRIALLSDLSSTVAEQAHDWVEAAREIKQLPADSPLVGEEWLSGPYPVLASAAALRESLEALSQGRSPVDGFSVVGAPGGRLRSGVAAFDPRPTAFQRIRGGRVDAAWCRGVDDP